MAEPLGHYQEQRVGVFVDTQNLYHSARDYYERNVNFESLLRFAVGGRRLVRATAYVVEKEGDTSAWPFIYKLSTIGYKVRRMYLTVKETGEVIAFRETTAQRLIDAVDRFTHLPEIPGAFMEPRSPER
mgnify:CR=1 FL=1